MPAYIHSEKMLFACECSLNSLSTFLENSQALTHGRTYIVNVHKHDKNPYKNNLNFAIVLIHEAKYLHFMKQYNYICEG